MLSLYMALVETESGRVLFETIFYDYQQRMYYIANQILADEHLSEDAVQNALLSVAMTIDKVCFKSDNEIKAYIYTATKRAALEIKRKEARKIDVVQRYQPTAPLFEPDLFDGFSNKEVLLQVMAIIEKMPPYYREVLFYSSVYDMNSTQMGELLGRPAATIRKQLIRARSMLSALCEKEGIQFGD